MRYTRPAKSTVLPLMVAIVTMPTTHSGWRIAVDEEIAAELGIARRALQYRWQALSDCGAAEVGRRRRGSNSRLVRPLPHPYWRIAIVAAEVDAEMAA